VAAVQGTDGPRLYKTLPASLTAAMVVVASARAESGLASYYPGVGRADEMTCAHRTRPMGSMVTVTYRGRAVRCRVNDRGPFMKGRVIDVSMSAARALGMIDDGVVLVSLHDDEMPSEIIRLVAPP
jgi:peptidoglycan lytic transglycosylase